VSPSRRLSTSTRSAFCASGSLSGELIEPVRPCRRKTDDLAPTVIGVRGPLHNAGVRQLIERDRLQTFDVVLANPPYSIKKWNREAWQNDPWGRNFLGTPPQGRADYAFFQAKLATGPHAGSHSMFIASVSPRTKNLEAEYTASLGTPYSEASSSTEA
jgi:hypothetical protein